MRKPLATLIITLAGISFSARGAAPTTEPIGDAALAERFAQMAQNNLAVRAISDTTLTEASAWLQAACKLNATDSRLAHLRAEACLSLHDTTGALEAFKQAAAIDGYDQVAQVKIIDLYAAGLQTADAKITYYQNLLKADRVSSEVKGHVAYCLARDLDDRGQATESKEALANALQLNPLDPDALEMNERQARQGTSREHVASLLALLRSNPAQPAITAKLAAELAEEGLTSEAGTWYSNSVSVTSRLGTATDPAVFCDYVAEMLIGKQLKGIDAALDSLLSHDPANASALYLKVLIARRGGEAETPDKDTIAKANDAAREGFLQNLYASYRQASNNTANPPATQPTGVLADRTGDVVAEARFIKKSGNEDAIAAAALALTNIAWLEIYFDEHSVNTASLVNALHELLPDDDTRFARLEGWSLLAEKKPDEAKVKLSAVADRDPLAAMGVIRIAAADPAQKDDAISSAQTLLNDNRAGLLAVMLLDGLQEQGPTVEVSKDGLLIKGDLAKFPKEWFSFLDNAEGFYLLSCLPLSIPHMFDEPMFAIVNVTNISPFDLSIGTRGALHPDLWFDVNIRGPLAPESLVGVAYDRLGKRLVLRKGDSFQQVVRLDQPKITPRLQQNPLAAYTLIFSLVTNPMPTSTGVAPGPGGQRVLVKKPVERSANPLNVQRQQMLQAVLNGKDSSAKISSISLLGAFAQSFLQNKDEKMQAQAKQLGETIAQLTNDPSPGVVAWTRMIQISLEAPENRAKTFAAMSASEYWPERLLAASAALASAEQGKPTLDKLKDDQEPLVKKFAQAALDDLAHPTTQPATAPASPTTSTPDSPPPTSAPALRL